MRVLVFFTLLLFLCSCAGGKDVGVSAQTHDKPSQEQVAKKPIVDAGYEQKTDPFRIEKAEVRGTNLHVAVVYSGGCKGHVFELFTDGTMMKSLPPQQVFFLRHYAHQDQCEAAVQEELVFDFRGQLPPGNTLVIRLSGYKEGLRMEF